MFVHLSKSLRTDCVGLIQFYSMNFELYNYSTQKYIIFVQVVGIEIFTNSLELK